MVSRCEDQPVGESQIRLTSKCVRGVFVGTGKSNRMEYVYHISDLAKSQDADRDPGPVRSY